MCGVITFAVALWWATRPALDGFFVGDEIDQLATLEGVPVGSATPHDLWNLWRPGPRSEHARYEGTRAWYEADVSYRMAFFRPVSSVAVQGLHVVGGRRPLPYHVASLVLLALVAALGFRVLRGAVEPAVAVLAVGLIVLHPALTDSLLFLCTIHTLIAPALGLAAVLALHDPRLAHVKTATRVLLAAALWAAALLAGEITLQLLAVAGIVAIGLGKEGRWKQRAAPYVLFGALAVGFLAYHTLAGYGADGNGYADPRSSPVVALKQAVRAVGVCGPQALLGFTPSCAFTPFVGDEAKVLDVAPGLQVAALVLGVLVLIAAAVLEQRLRRPFAVLFVAAVVACIPAGFVQPGTRQYVVPVFVTSTMLALALVALARRAWASPRLVARFAGLAVLTLVVAANVGLASAARHQAIEVLGGMQFGPMIEEQRACADVLAHAETHAAAGAPRLVLRAPPDLSVRSLRTCGPGRLPPTVWWNLGFATPVRVTRPDAGTLIVEALPASDDDRERLPHLEGMVPPRKTALGTYTVLEAPEGVMTRFQLVLDPAVRELEGVVWDGDHLTSVELPAVGSSREFP